MKKIASPMYLTGGCGGTLWTAWGRVFPILAKSRSRLTTTRVCLALLVIFISLFATQPATAEQKVNIQVSDPENRPMRGVRITTKCPGTTETTDDGGKATITYTPISQSGPVELIIVSPQNLDFISPWQRSVTVPPNYWPLVVVPHGKREMLEHPRVVTALAARTSALQVRKAPEDPAPSAASLTKAISEVAGEHGLNTMDVRASFDQLSTHAEDDYARGMALLVHQEYRAAAPLLAKVLDRAQASTKQDYATHEQALNASYFLGQAEFESGRYRQAAAAYHIASRLRPDDPTILNNEGLSLSKAGDFEGAERLYQRALEIMKNTNTAKSVPFSTTTNNLAATLAYQGEFSAADNLFSQALALRRELLSPDDLRIAISLNNVAAMKITEGKCKEATPALDEAFRIQSTSRETADEDARNASPRALLGTAPPNSLAANPSRGITAVPPDCVAVGTPPCFRRPRGLFGFVPISSSPSIFTTRTNQAMLSFCLGDYQKAIQMLDELRNGQFGIPPGTDMGNIYFGSARVEEARGEFTLAAQDYAQSIRIYQDLLGRNHPVLSQVFLQYGSLLGQQGQTKKAQDALHSAQRIEELNFGKNSTRAAAIKDQLNSLGK